MRKQALNWWNSLTDLARYSYCMLFYPDRTYTSLTGKEIECIYQDIDLKTGVQQLST